MTEAQTTSAGRSADDAGAARPVDPGLFQAIVESQPLLFVVLDESAVITYASPASQLVLGLPPEQIVGRPATDFVPEEDLGTALAALVEVRDDQVVASSQYAATGVPMPLRLYQPDGSTTIVEVGAQSRLDDPAVRGVILRIRALAGQQWLDRALEALVESSPLEEVLEFLAASLSHELPSAEAAILWDHDHGRFRSATGRGLPAALTGLARERGPWVEALETGVLVDPADLSGLTPTLRREAEDAGFATCWALPVLTAQPHGPHPGAAACVVVWRRVTGRSWTSHRLLLDRAAHLTALALERRQTEERLRHAALHDALTGLPNRAQFFGCLDELGAPPTPRETGPRVAVLYLDLDGFKPVNDSHGHATGDEVLRIVGQRLAGVVRGGDVLARLGGDEFAIICRGVASEDEVTAAADRLIAAVREPIRTRGSQAAQPELVSVGVSVGIAIGDASARGTQLLDLADAALYRAKAAGKGTWQLAH